MSDPSPPAPALRELTWLDGLPAGPTAIRLASALEEDGRLGPVHHLRDEVFAPCRGCWECWVDHPGTCTAHDAGNAVMHDVIGSDAVLWSTRISFGGWSSVAKAAFDKCIGLISPFFASVEGETHHHRRYGHYPRMGVLAVTGPDTSEREREVFRWLIERNALNFHAGRPWVGFVDEHADATRVRAAVREGLGALERPAPEGTPRVSAFPPRDDATGVPARPDRARHVTLWVGSAKASGESTSESIGQALVNRLVDRGWTSETVHSMRSVRLGRDGAPKLVEAVRRADLLVLSLPVYVDSLPALVIAGLEQLARADLGSRPPALLPIVQCGFPELAHTGLALEILDIAAHRLHMPWAGHLAMGGGGAIDGRPLDALGGRVHHQLQALTATAQALDLGQGVPPTATEAFAHASLGPAAYRVTGQLGWIAAAVAHGSLFDLWKRPFAEAGEG